MEDISIHPLKVILKTVARMIFLKLKPDYVISVVKIPTIYLTPFYDFSTSQIEIKFVKEADRFSVGNLQRVIVLC